MPNPVLASDVWRLGALRWDARRPMLKTMAAKHKSTVTRMAAKHKAKIQTPHGLRTCFDVARDVNEVGAHLPARHPRT
jgi:hypothetical protein